MASGYLLIHQPLQGRLSELGRTRKRLGPHSKTICLGVQLVPSNCHLFLCEGTSEKHYMRSRNQRGKFFPLQKDVTMRNSSPVDLCQKSSPSGPGAFQKDPGTLLFWEARCVKQIASIGLQSISQSICLSIYLSVFIIIIFLSSSSICQSSVYPTPCPLKYWRRLTTYKMHQWPLSVVLCVGRRPPAAETASLRHLYIFLTNKVVCRVEALDYRSMGPPHIQILYLLHLTFPQVSVVLPHPHWHA